MNNSKLTLAGLSLGVVLAMTAAAAAQGMQGGMGQGMMERDGQAGGGTAQGGMGPGMMGPGMMGGGMRQGMMGQQGSGMTRGGMGPEMDCPMMESGMMQGGMRRGMMGSAMMGSGTGGGMESLFGTRVRPVMNLSVDDVRNYLSFRLDRLGNKRLKVGNVSPDGDTITAEIATVDNSLVQRMKVDRHTGRIEYED